MAGIYIHIPFCKQSCHYCDFHFSTVKTMVDDIVDALAREIELQKDYLGKEEITTLYFGGGTPSLLSFSNLRKIMSAAHRHFSLSENTEITLEANPDDLSLEKLHELRSLGINRLSIGIQTFNDEYLKYLNRAHDSKNAIACMKNARDAGFQNISMDLIYSIREDDHKTLLTDLEHALFLQPEHISAYCLTIEPKTAFGNWLKKEKIKTVDENYSVREFEILMESMEKMGYEQYEISNFARDGYYSRHNSSYWNHVPYLGIGPSAHSFDGSSRQFNVANNAKYLKAISKNVVPFELEKLEKTNLINELIMTGLRTKWGCDTKKIGEKYDYNLLEKEKALLDGFVEKSLIRIENEKLFLTQSGKLLADEIAAQLFLT